MKQHQEQLSITTPGRGLVEITNLVQRAVRDSALRTGVCTIFVQHTSASLVIQENADPSAKHDLERFLERLAPENDPAYTHTAEGSDDMPSHLRSALTQTAETIPIHNGRLALGTWQGIFLCEHRAREHRRTVMVHLMGEQAQH